VAQVTTCQAFTFSFTTTSPHYYHLYNKHNGRLRLMQIKKVFHRVSKPSPQHHARPQHGRHTRPSHEPCPRGKVADEPRARGAAGASKSPLRRLSCTTACMRGRGGEPRTPERALTAGASRERPEKALLSPASESSRRGATHRSAKDTNVEEQRHVPPPSDSLVLLKYNDKSCRTPHRSQDIILVSFSCAQMEHCHGPELPHGSSRSDRLSVLGTN
jgi:hypothetical protein